MLPRAHDAIHAIYLKLFGWMVIALCRQTVRRIGEVKRAVRFIDQIIRAVQFLPLIRIGEHRDRRLRIHRLQPPDVAPRMARDTHPSVSIERHAIRAWLRSAVGLSSRISARVHEYGRALAGDPLDDVVRGNLRKQQRAVARPHRTLGPLVEAAGNLFEPRVLGNDLVECRIEPLNFLTGRRCCHERQAH